MYCMNIIINLLRPSYFACRSIDQGASLPVFAIASVAKDALLNDKKYAMEQFRFIDEARKLQEIGSKVVARKKTEANLSLPETAEKIAEIQSSIQLLFKARAVSSLERSVQSVDRRKERIPPLSQTSKRAALSAETQAKESFEPSLADNPNLQVLADFFQGIDDIPADLFSSIPEDDVVAVTRKNGKDILTIQPGSKSTILFDLNETLVEAPLVQHLSRMQILERSSLRHFETFGTIGPKVWGMLKSTFGQGITFVNESAIKIAREGNKLWIEGIPNIQSCVFKGKGKLDVTATAWKLRKTEEYDVRDFLHLLRLLKRNPS